MEVSIMSKEKINQSILEERINRRAEDRFYETLKSFRDSIGNNPIGMRLKIDDVKLSYKCANGGITTDNILNIEKIECKTNLKEIKKELIEEYKQEETDEILRKLENINYLFNQ